MAAARSRKPRWADTNGLLARNFGQGPLQVNRRSRIGVAVLNRMLGSVARIPSVPPRKPHDPGDKPNFALKFSVQQRRWLPRRHPA